MELLDFFLFQNSDCHSDPSDHHSDVLSRTSSQESLGTAETSAEWQPTRQIQHRLYYLNNFPRIATEGRVSQVRSKCQSDVFTTSSRTKRCYRKKKRDRLLKPCLNPLPLETPSGSTRKSCCGALVYRRPRV